MRVLFVDDNALNRSVVGHMMAAAGIALDEAPEARTGLAMAGAQDYDLILMDLRMPGMDGLAAIQQIRSGGDRGGRVPIIVVTADSAVDIRSRCLAAGADDLVQKPVIMDVLFDSIARVMSAAPDGLALLA